MFSKISSKFYQTKLKPLEGKLVKSGVLFVVWRVGIGRRESKSQSRHESHVHAQLYMHKSRTAHGFHFQL